jgi:hypothetical protein
MLVCDIEQRSIGFSTTFAVQSGNLIPNTRAMVQFPVGARELSFFRKCPHRLWGTPSLLFNSYQALFLRGGVGADHWPSSRPEVKNAWIFTYTPPFVFKAVCLVMDGYIFAFT